MESRLVVRASLILAMADGASNHELPRAQNLDRGTVRYWRWNAADLHRRTEIVRIIAVSCEVPGKSERPISHWSPAKLAGEDVKRKIVESLPVSSIERFLSSGRSQTESN